jgi:hypothetical protein
MCPGTQAEKTLVAHIRLEVELGSSEVGGPVGYQQKRDSNVAKRLFDDNASASHSRPLDARLLKPVLLENVQPLAFPSNGRNGVETEY